MNGHRTEGSDANGDEGGGGGCRKAGSYNSSLHVWRFFTSEDDPQAVHNEAVCLNESFSSFDKNQVYLALHIYSENVAASRPIKIANGGLNSSEPATLGGGGGESSRATIESLLASSVEAFTPRGLAACLEEAFITSTSSSADLEGGSSTSQDDDNGEAGDAVTGNSSTGGEEGETQPLAYSLYVWRGKDSTRYAQALALTKSFELEKALKKDGKKALQQLFGGEDKVPLSSVFTTHNNLLLRLPNTTSTSTPGESDDGARRLCTHRHADEDYDDVDSEDEGNTDGGSEEDEERPYSRQHHLYHQLLKRRRLTRKSAAGGEAGENPCTDSGCNGSVPKLSLPRVKDLFQAPPPTSPSGHGRGRSLSADSLDAIIHTAIQDLDSPQPTSAVGSGITDGVALLTVDSPSSSSSSSYSSSSSGKTTRTITKSTSLTIPSPSVAPPSPKKLLGKGKLKLPPIKTEGMSKSGPMQAIPISGFNLQDLQALQEKEQSSDSDTFTKAEANQRQDKLTKYDSICSKITDQLYLGSQTVSQDKAMLKQQGVTHILNCAGSICPIYHPNDFTYRTLYLLDGVREDITCMLYDIIEWMDNVITSNGKILVHCQQGVSRSSAMMIGYLMWKHGWGFERTHMFVKERRGVSSPNTGFICQLLELAKRLSLARGGADRGTRLYQVVTHTRHDPDFVVAKLARKENLAELEESSAPSPSCYILQSPEEFFIWVGAQCNERFVEVAERTVRRVQHFENATKVVHTVEQGKETEEFKRCLGQLNLDELT